MKQIKNIGSFVLFSLFLLSLFSNYGCNMKPSEITEGKIIYDISYPDAASTGLVATMLPKELVVYFKDDKMCTEFYLGTGDVRMISDADKKSYTMLANVMSKKIAMKFKESDVNNNFKDRADLKIKFTENTKEIAGIKCQEANITDSTEHHYCIYYTHQLRVKSPNWSTPYHEIDGVMMEYSVNLNDIIMNLKAQSISYEKVNDAVFKVPYNYIMYVHTVFHHYTINFMIRGTPVW